MDYRIRIIADLLSVMKQGLTRSYEFPWDEARLCRSYVLRLRRGDATAWQDFLARLAVDDWLAENVAWLLQAKDYIFRAEDGGPFYFQTDFDGDVRPEGMDELMKLVERMFRADWTIRAYGFCPTEHGVLRSGAQPDQTGKSKSRILYIEAKPGLTGPGRIGRVRFSKTGKTIYYGGRKFRSLKGGYKANYCDTVTLEEFWITGCRKDGQDTLYPGIIEIDDDVRQEYWLTIRDRPDLVEQRSFRSEGKYRR
jgi:hypothetical protein